MSFTRADYPPLSTIGYVSTITSVTFVPTTITGCTFWVDGADPLGTGTPPSDGTSLSTWYDKSGSGYNAIASSAATVKTNIQNSKSIVRFNSNIYNVTYPSFPHSGYTFFTVMYLSTNTGSYSRLINGSSGDGYLFIGTSGSSVATFNGNGGWNDTSPNSPTINNYQAWCIVAVTVGSSVLTPYVNGTAQNTKTGTTAAFSNFIIGSYSGQAYSGDIGDLIVYNSVLTTTQRQQVEGYLAWKWGLQASLPGGHPYASTNPNAGFASTLTSTILLNLTGYVQSGANYILKPQIPLATFGYYTGFNPISLSTLALWIDGADPLGTGVAPAQGTLLSSFKDKSGNNTPISTFSTTVGFPIYKTAANGALGTIQLAAGNGLLISSIAMTPYMSLYAVYSPINPSTGVSIEQGTNALANAGFLLTSVSTTSTIYAISISKFPIFTGATSNYTYGGYKFYYYTTAGNTAATITNSEGTNINAFILAGGGGGGGWVGSGGGAGGLLSTVGAFSGSYTITVGGGGTAGASSGIAPNGGNSVFNSLTAIGGGGGGAAFSSGATGGCGGGAGFNNSPGSGTTGQGYGGGTNNPGGAGAGGGGIGSAGSNTLGLQTANEIGANGGFGYGGTAVSIFLDGLQYGGGGGGGGSGNTGANIAGGIAYSGGGNGGRGFNDGTAIGSNATNGKGGGGGGGGNYNGGGSQPAGGTGGSGVVILYHTL